MQSTENGSCNDTSPIFRNVVCLAPMVRAGSLAFRSLCLKYDADLVWGEEIIDKRLIKCERVVNERLKTIDFIANGKVLVFRTAAVETGKVVFQMGTCSATTALAAAKLVENDVCAIDINMGCPKKFSIQGGMGAALLSNPDTACDIVSVLSKGLSIPVTAKIRIVDTVEDTINIMRMLESAGASAITVHLRTKNMPSSDPARWEDLRALVQCVRIPVLANGDVYTRGDAFHLMSTTGCAGVMMARPLLLNPSVLIKGPASDDIISTSLSDLDESIKPSKPLRDVICDFLRECIAYEPHFQIVKYTIQEMMSSRRHCPQRLKRLRTSGLSFGRLDDVFHRVCEAKSLSEVCSIFGVSTLEDDDSGCDHIAKKRKSTHGSSENEQLSCDHRFEDSYFQEEKQS